MPHRLLPRMLSHRSVRFAKLQSAKVAPTRSQVQLRWDDGTETSLDSVWLRDNCPSARDPVTKQKLRSAADLPSQIEIDAVEVNPGMLSVHWSDSDQASVFCSTWLRDLAGIHGGEPSHHPSAEFSVPQVQSFRFDELLCSSMKTRWEWIDALAKHGATVLEDVPPNISTTMTNFASTPPKDPSPALDRSLDAVQYVAELIGPLQPNIYGHMFDVVSSEDDDAINIACADAHCSLVHTCDRQAI